MLTSPLRVRRSPLVALTAASHILRIADPTHDAAADARGVIERQTKHMSRMIEHQVLALQGHRVKEARDGASGIAEAAAMQPDVAIIDIGLPDVDGYEVARRIRAEAKRPIALIALTGYGQPEDQRRARDAGFDLHLVKPVTVERLDHAIASLDPSSVSLRLG